MNYFHFCYEQRFPRKKPSLYFYLDVAINLENMLKIIKEALSDASIGVLNSLEFKIKEIQINQKSLRCICLFYPFRFSISLEIFEISF